MIPLRSFRSACSLLAKCILTLSVALGTVAYGQTYSQDQEVRVHDLPSLMARSHDPSDVFLTSLDTVFHDREVCCGKDSALEDSALASDPKSLKDVASRLQGRHLLSDGRPIMVTAEYLPPESINSGHLVRMIRDGHPPIMEWNSRLYVVEGLVYVWVTGNDGGTLSEIHEFLLVDTRFSDSRRQVVFTRGIDDIANI